MSSSLPHPPNSSQITLASLKYILTIYQDTVNAFYVTKVKDAKKRVTAIKTDQWRYEELPVDIAKEKSDDVSDQGLTLEQLERLAEWKITHGKFRPFLLPQIRKNAPAAVLQATRKSQAVLLSDKSGHSVVDESTIKEALDAVCVLNGVGPATGTLLLSVFTPRTVPFFQDELYSWLHRENSGPSLETIKLKYTTKEYFELVQGVRALIARLGGSDQVQSWEVEKVGFVIGHWELVGQEERTRIWELIEIDHVTAGTKALSHAGRAALVRDKQGPKRKRDDQDDHQHGVKLNVRPAAAEHGQSTIPKGRSSTPSAAESKTVRSDRTRQSSRIGERK